MKITQQISFFIMTVLAIGTVQADENYWQRPEVQQFAKKMVEEHHFNNDDLQRWFSQATKRQSIIDAMMRPAEGKPWHQYRPIFVTDKRIRNGVRFWQEHNDLLMKAEQKYGVPAAIIVAIIGVETYYGRHIGRYPVIDSLATLGFDYPPRAKFFKRELEKFLILAQKENLDMNKTVGSYAGAMGMGQFISSSYLEYAVDFDQDGKRDLWQVNDAIGSVANYFKRHGWRTGEAVAIPADAQGKQHNKEGRMMKPHRPIESFRQQGLLFDKQISTKDNQAVLVKLDVEGGYEYWLGLHNFYVISRYNHSPLYSMAVFQLSEEIKKRMHKAQ